MRTCLSLLLGVALAACGREPSPPRPAPGAPATATPTPTAPAATPHAATMARLDRIAASGDSVSAGSLRTLGGRLEYEATHRPAATPKVEDVLAALDRAGIALAEQKQYVATTVKAAYCVGGQTADGLSIAICEYASPAEAAAGRAYVTDRFRIPDLERVIHVRGATTLALGHHTGAPLAPVTRRAADAFLTL